MSSHNTGARPAPDQVLTDIADYVMDYEMVRPEAYQAARYFVIDALGCAMEALNFPECTKLLGPAIPGTLVPNGARVPGTAFELDPMTAAFNLGTMIRWLDFNEVFSGVHDGGHPSALTAKTYGFYDAIFRGECLKFRRPYGCSMLENVIYKFIAAGLHGQSAAECAFRLHPQVQGRLDDIDTVTISSHRSLIRIMDKQGPLSNAADRDHCAQYVIAVALIFGKLDTSDYEDDFAADPRIDRLRARMVVVEEPRYTRDRTDPDKQSNAIAIDVRFRDGSTLTRVEVEYPLGHVRRRVEALPSLEAKFRKHLARRFSHQQQSAILEVCLDQDRFESTPVNEFVARFVIN